MDGGLSLFSRKGGEIRLLRMSSKLSISNVRIQIPLVPRFPLINSAAPQKPQLTNPSFHPKPSESYYPQPRKPTLQIPTPYSHLSTPSTPPTNQCVSSPPSSPAPPSRLQPSTSPSSPTNAPAPTKRPSCTNPRCFSNRTSTLPSFLTKTRRGKRAGGLGTPGGWRGGRMGGIVKWRGWRGGSRG